MKDFKALTVKQGIFNQTCISNLTKILAHRAPYHISEVCIIDCRIAPSLISEMMQMLSE